MLIYTENCHTYLYMNMHWCHDYIIAPYTIKATLRSMGDFVNQPKWIDDKVAAEQHLSKS